MKKSDKETIKQQNSQYKEFMKSAAGKDLLSYLENSVKGTLKSAQTGSGYIVEEGGTKQVTMESHQIHNMIGRSFAFDQVLEYLKRRSK